MTYSICIPTVTRPYRSHIFKRLVETGTLEHPLVKGFHIGYDRGPNDNAEHVMRQAIADNTDVILFLEDDIEIIDDFIGSIDRWLQDVRNPRVHVYQLGFAPCNRTERSHAHKAIRRRELTYKIPLQYYFGSCGLAFFRNDLIHYCDTYATRPDWMEHWKGLDVNISRWHERLEGPDQYIPAPIPCFIDHRGLQSSVGSRWTKGYMGFVGTEYRYPEKAPA